MYDADHDPAWFRYLIQYGDLSWKRGQPEYEELMTRYQKEGIRFENKKNDSQRARGKRSTEEARWREDFRSQ